VGGLEFDARRRVPISRGRRARVPVNRLLGSAIGALLLAFLGACSSDPAERLSNSKSPRAPSEKDARKGSTDPSGTRAPHEPEVNGDFPWEDEGAPPSDDINEGGSAEIEWDEEDGSIPSYRKSAAVHQYTSPVLALGDPWLNSTTSPSAATAHCSDGARDASAVEEECDTGPLATEACSVGCRARDFLASGAMSAKFVQREFGTSVHPLAGHPLAPGGVSSAAVTWHEVNFGDGAPPTPKVMLQLLDRHGNRIGTNTNSVDGRYTGAPSSGLVQVNEEGSVPTTFANPVVAPVYPATPSASSAFIDPRIAHYVVAWNELGGEGSDLGIAFRKVTVDASGLTHSVTLGTVQHPSDGAVWGQQDPDLITLPNGNVILAWTDMRSPVTAPDVRFRAFLPNLEDVGEFSLATTSAVEGSINLATVPGDSGGFFYAYREALTNGGEAVVVGRRTGIDLETPLTVRVQPPLIGGQMPGPAPEGQRPAIVGLDSNRALVVFPIGTDPNNTGVPQVFRLWAAVVDVTTNTVRGSGQINPLVAPYSTEATLSLTHPTLVEAGADGLWLAWHSGVLLGNANAEELWLKKLDWSPTAAGMGLTLTTAEYPLPRESAHQAGDQRAPALAVLSYPGGGRALGMAWEDWGATFGPNSAKPDVVLEVAPPRSTRMGENYFTCSSTNKCAAGQGHCTANDQCTTGLTCTTLAGRGLRYGYGPGVRVCEASSCADGIKNGSETETDCGGPCGKCLTCPAAAPYNGTAHFASAACPKATKLGDCDSNNDCASGQVCTLNAGPRVNLNSYTDICLPLSCSNNALDAGETRTDCGGATCAPCQVGSPTYCTPTLKCASGEGHCEDSSECNSGLVCASGQGPLYGLPAGVSVCVPTGCENTATRGKPGEADFCTSACGCADGIGVCDSNTECLGNATSVTRCAPGRGSQYGYANETKLCVPNHCYDGLANADETQVDCGGSCGDMCPRCATTGSVRNFDTAADWGRPSYGTGGLAPTLSAVVDATTGTSSLKATGSKYEELWSREFSADELDFVGSKVLIDVKHTAQSPPAANTWIGSFELRVVFGNGTRGMLIPTRDFLQGVTPGWITLEGDVDAKLQSALKAKDQKFRLEIRLNRTQLTDTWVDNLRFGGTTTPITECYGSGGSFTGPAGITLAGTTSSVASLLSFEAAANWTGSPTASVVTSTDQTLGSNSLSVTQASGTQVTFTSTQFASSNLAAAFPAPVGLTQKLTLDVKTPAPATGQTLGGSIRLVLACPSANIWWSDAVAISTLPENQWARARFTFPRALKTNLNTTGINCAIRLESELTGQASGAAILYDNLRFEHETPCAAYTNSNNAPFLTNMPVTPDGTQKRPYPICSSAQLTTVRNSASLRDAHFILMQDLDLTGWNNMIGAEGAIFRGTFDGQGKTIRNHSRQSGRYLGLFGWVDGDTAVDGNLDGMVLNLRLENSNITGTYGLGALVGVGRSARIHNVTVVNPRIIGTADSLGGLLGSGSGSTKIVDSAALGVYVESATNYVGGLVGYTQDQATVRGCRTDGVVTSRNGILGGLVGYMTGEVSGSTSSATVAVTWPVSGVCGGLLGVLVGSVRNSSASGSVVGSAAIGGLVGRSSGGPIVDCRASGSVTGTTYVSDWGAGGLVGQGNVNLAITRSSATGNVSSPSGVCVGGLAGLIIPGTGNNVPITDSYATGNVVANMAGGAFAGCLINSTVVRTYGTGTVQFRTVSPYPSAAFAASGTGTTTYAASVLPSTTNPTLPIVLGPAPSAGVTRFATSLFESQTAFAELGWDFTNVWIMGPSGPVLR
jgi:hypothetical protein